MATGSTIAKEFEVVELGFVEKSPSWLLKSKFFRCKIGGMPSWLTLENIPDFSSVQCPLCNKPRSFLLQVYAPVDDQDEAFHRTVFMFICLDGKCCKMTRTKNIVVFRTQLPRQNAYYDFEPPTETEAGSNLPSASQFQSLCDICGCKGTVQCENCGKRNYCSRAHELLDLEMGHKDLCGVDPATRNPSGKKKRNKKKKKGILPEYELVTDTEILPTQPKEKSDDEKMKDYHKFLQSSKGKSCMEEGQLDGVDNFVRKPDKLFNKFQKRVAYEPDQVLRYQKGGTPLWISSEHQPLEKDIPNCECGAKRAFEFQVMPQLLSHLSLDGVGNSVDWGTILIYTCSKSCSLGTAKYVKEFAWKQDVSDDLEKS